MRRKVIFLFTIFSIIGCVGCGKSNSYTEETKSSEKTVDFQEEKAEIENLSQQVAELRVYVKDMQDVLNGTTKKEEASISQKETPSGEVSSYEQYINMKFPKTEKTYCVRKDNKVKFYKDVYCTQEISDIPNFASSNADSGAAPNGLSIYSFRTVNNEIIYTTQKPIIVEVEN